MEDCTRYQKPQEKFNKYIFCPYILPWSIFWHIFMHCFLRSKFRCKLGHSNSEIYNLIGIEMDIYKYYWQWLLMNMQWICIHVNYGFRNINHFMHVCTLCLSIFLSVYLSIYLSLSIYLYLCLSIYLSIYLSCSLSIYLFINLSVCLSVYLNISLSIYLSF